MQEELVPELDALLAKADEYLVSLWLSEPTDANSAYIEIHPGSGGTEACDWAAMLARMYTKWAHSREYSGSSFLLIKGTVLKFADDQWKSSRNHPVMLLGLIRPPF